MDSDYDISWYGKTNVLRYANLLVLCTRGDIEKVKLTSKIGKITYVNCKCGK